jgi:hypothetical protein
MKTGKPKLRRHQMLDKALLVVTVRVVRPSPDEAINQNSGSLIKCTDCVFLRATFCRGNFGCEYEKVYVTAEAAPATEEEVP